jgi:hypothetical protein
MSNEGIRLVLALAAIACSASAARHPFTYKQPFSLEGTGVGPNPVQGELVLKREDEEPFVSRVLLQAIQAFHHLSIPERPQTAAEPLLPHRDYKTDIAPLADDDVRQYNAANPPPLALDSTLLYALQFGIRYEIQVDRQRVFFIQIEPFLYAKGSAAPTWRPYKRAYSGDFFAGRLIEALKSNFTIPTRINPPAH